MKFRKKLLQKMIKMHGYEFFRQRETECFVMMLVCSLHVCLFQHENNIIRRDESFLLTQKQNNSFFSAPLS